MNHPAGILPAESLIHQKLLSHSNLVVTSRDLAPARVNLSCSYVGLECWSKGSVFSYFAHCILRLEYIILMS